MTVQAHHFARKPSRGSGFLLTGETLLEGDDRVHVPIVQSQFGVCQQVEIGNRKGPKCKTDLAGVNRREIAKARPMASSKKGAPYLAFARRLHAACDHAEIEQGRGRVTVVATLFGVARETARLWFAGRTLPEFDRLMEMARDFGVQLEWLAMGRGPMVFDASYAHGIAEESLVWGDPKSKREAELLRRFKLLSEPKQEALLELLKPER